MPKSLTVSMFAPSQLVYGKGDNHGQPLFPGAILLAAGFAPAFVSAGTVSIRRPYTARATFSSQHLPDIHQRLRCSIPCRRCDPPTLMPQLCIRCEPRSSTCSWPDPTDDALGALSRFLSPTARLGAVCCRWSGLSLSVVSPPTRVWSLILRECQQGVRGNRRLRRHRPSVVVGAHYNTFRANRRTPSSVKP